MPAVASIEFPTIAVRQPITIIRAVMPTVPMGEQSKCIRQAARWAAWWE